MDEASWQARAEEHERWLARMRPMLERMAAAIIDHEDRLSQHHERISQNERMYQALITTLQEIRDRL